MWLDVFGLSKHKYRTHDVGPHSELSPQANRHIGHGNNKQDNNIQSHHFIAQDWVRTNVQHPTLSVGNINRNAPAVLIPSSSGSSHARISQSQTNRRKKYGGGK